MLRASGHMAFLFALAATSSCTAGGRLPDAGGSSRDAGVDASSTPPDAGAMRCEADSDCDDGFACTLDECRVGNVCAYTTLDSRCNDEERCVEGRGCVGEAPTDCETSEDCDDGLACNGEESCLRNMCIPGTAVTCNDGNDCTIDVCDESVATLCRYELADGCDAGTARVDAGPGCDAFEPTTDYSGSFRLLPGQACDAGLGRGYRVSDASFSVSGDTLTVTVGPFTLTQSPAPTDGSFSVSGSNSCASVTLSGDFECETRWRGTWTASHSGDCAVCGSTPATNVVGTR